MMLQLESSIILPWSLYEYGHHSNPEDHSSYGDYLEESSLMDTVDCDTDPTKCVCCWDSVKTCYKFS
jgi:hypothetical protein